MVFCGSILWYFFYCNYYRILNFKLTLKVKLSDSVSLVLLLVSVTSSRIFIYKWKIFTQSYRTAASELNYYFGQLSIWLKDHPGRRCALSVCCWTLVYCKQRSSLFENRLHGRLVWKKFIVSVNVCVKNNFYLTSSLWQGTMGTQGARRPRCVFLAVMELCKWKIQ